MDSESDREYLEKLLIKIEQLGVEVEHRSNLISIASRLHLLRTQETDPRHQERLDFELDAIMRVIDGNEPHVPTSIDEHIDRAQQHVRAAIAVEEQRNAAGDDQ